MYLLEVSLRLNLHLVFNFLCTPENIDLSMDQCAISNSIVIVIVIYADAIWRGNWLVISYVCSCTVTRKYIAWYTPSQRGNYHHSMFHNPTAAVNLFHVGKQYLTLCKAEAAVTRNLIGRKIISNVKHADARNSLPILDVIRSSHKRHSASEYCK